MKSPEVKELINEISQLMRNLSHSTRTEVTESKGFIRGRIDKDDIEVKKLIRIEFGHWRVNSMVLLNSQILLED